jgi:hypothetical protein
MTDPMGHFRPCEACGQPTRAYFNDTPVDVQLTAAEAVARGVEPDMVVDIPCGSYGLTLWGIVRIVDEPVETWPYLGQAPKKSRKDPAP